MVNYKKLTDVEVMEEVSENSMALVNENGVLKQVPCGAGFGGGGGNTAIIQFTGTSDGGSVASVYTSSGVQTPTMQFICNNMTYSDVLSSLQNGVFVNIVAIGRVGDFLAQGIANGVKFAPDNNHILIGFTSMPFTELYWYSDNTISMESPSISPSGN